MPDCPSLRPSVEFISASASGKLQKSKRHIHVILIGHFMFVYVRVFLFLS